MSRMTDLIAIEYITRNHCADPECQKCSARVRWLRRKGWRNSKTRVRKNENGRK